jgi:lysophospholipase L1-like esterase
MVKHLNPSKLRKGTKHNINVQTFSGANVADMRYYVKPAISRSPDYLLLHVGTNDLKRQTPQQIAGSISTLCQEIVKESPNTKIVLSKVITRSDDPSLNSKINELNCKLSQVCHNNKWGILNHTNITADHLNPYGLHLNKQGTAKLAKNIIDYFKNLN